MENNNSNTTQPNTDTQVQTPASTETPAQTTPPVTPQLGTQPPLQNSPTPPPVQKKGGKGIMIVIIIILIILILGGSAGYYYMKMQQPQPQSTKQTTTMKPAPTSNTLTIGVDSTYPPMESINKAGQYEGFDIDMGNMIGKELGKKVVWKTILFSDIFTDLNKNDYDIAISSITITPQREQFIDFSIPYLNAGEVLLVKKASSSADKIIETASDFNGKKIGVQSGTTDLTEAQKLFPPNLIVQYPSNIPALADLQSGKIDAIITDLPDAIGVVQANNNVRVATNPLDKEYYGIAFRKNETQLKNQINMILTNMQNQGILQQLTNKWLE